jgi:hypothetical protein
VPSLGRLAEIKSPAQWRPTDHPPDAVRREPLGSPQRVRIHRISLRPTKPARLRSSNFTSLRITQTSLPDAQLTSFESLLSTQTDHGS